MGFNWWCGSVRDDRAQMMLLTAVILLIGFVALAGMVARVSQLPQETVQESRDPVFAQIENIAEGMGNLIVEANATHNLALDPVDTKAMLDNGIVYFEQLLRARGYVSQWEDPACVDAAGDAEVTLAVTLHRGPTAASFSVTEIIPAAGASCWL